MNDPTKISAHPPPEQKKQVDSTDVMSKGEKLFDWLTYGGFAGAVTFALGMPFGYFTRYSKGGEAIHKWAVSHSRQLGMSVEATEDAVMNTALMQGGNVMLLPVKMMEDHKPQLVAKFNKMLGDDSGDCSVKDEPKQTWGSLLKSRVFLAWTPVFLALRGTAMLGGKESFNNFEKDFSKNIVCDPLGLPTHVNGQETKAFRLGRIAAIDVFATAAAATLLYIGSRMFARQNKEKWDGVTDKELGETVEEVAKIEEPLPAVITQGPQMAYSERHKPAQNHTERLSQQAPAAAALSA